jgi:hypothetical protein
MKIILTCILLFLSSVPSGAQVLKSTVTVDFGLMPAEEVNFLTDLAVNIEDYINNFAYTDDEYETDIDISIFIMVETVTQKGHEKMYKSQFQIKSTSGESFYDKDWEFSYQPGYLFDHSKIAFDPLCHFIDYYCYLVLGGELDGYAMNLGTPFYIEAKNLGNIGSLSKYQKGWGTRIQELDKITDIRTRPLREAKPDFFEAKYRLEEGKVQEAKLYALKVLDSIEKVVSEQPNNKYLRTFFDAHHRTFAIIFQGDKNALTRLVNYDNYHRDVYREVMP